MQFLSLAAEHVPKFYCGSDCWEDSCLFTFEAVFVQTSFHCKGPVLLSFAPCPGVLFT